MVIIKGCCQLRVCLQTLRKGPAIPRTETFALSVGCEKAQPPIAAVRVIGFSKSETMHPCSLYDAFRPFEAQAPERPAVSL